MHILSHVQLASYALTITKHTHTHTHTHTHKHTHPHTHTHTHLIFQTALITTCNTLTGSTVGRDLNLCVGIKSNPHQMDPIGLTVRSKSELCANQNLIFAFRVSLEPSAGVCVCVCVCV